MKKKSKQNNSLDICLICSSILFGVLSLLLMLAPAIVTKVSFLEVKYNVYELLKYDNEFRAGILFALVFAVVLLCMALLLAILKLLDKKSKLESPIGFCGALLGLVAGILLFFTKSLVGLANSGITTLGIGAVLAGIFAIIAALSLGFYTARKLAK